MDTSIMSFVLSGNYIKEGKIYRIYFSCKNGKLETSIGSNMGNHVYKTEDIFTSTFTVENYLEDFFSEHGGRIEYQGKSSLEEDIKRMIKAYGERPFVDWNHLAYDYNLPNVSGAFVEMVSKSYRDMINNEMRRAIEGMFEAGEEDETRR